jgi:hypothetical protein
VGWVRFHGVCLAYKQLAEVFTCCSFAGKFYRGDLGLKPKQRY